MIGSYEENEEIRILLYITIYYYILLFIVVKSCEEYMVWQKWGHLQRKQIDNCTIKPQTIIKQPGYVTQPDTLNN